MTPYLSPSLTPHSPIKFPIWIMEYARKVKQAQEESNSTNQESFSDQNMYFDNLVER